MTKIITAIALFVVCLVNAQTQFESGMGKALGTWKEGKNAEAAKLFETLAGTEKNSWLPNYYYALVNTSVAFKTKDVKELDILLSNAQEKLDIELAKNPNNPELIVLQAMIHTGYIISDPIVNGRKLFGTVTSLYAKAEAIAPQNPRVIFCKAEFAINGAPWTGINPKDICSDVEKSIKLFATFKPESKLSPNWGLDRAENAMKNCK